MVVLTLVAQKNGETVYFDEPIPQVHFMKLLSCSLYNSWDTLKGGGKVSLVEPDKTLKSSDFAPGNYTLESFAKLMVESFKPYIYEITAKAYSPLGQLVITNHGDKPIRFDHKLANLFGISQEPEKKVILIKRVMSPTAYFIHCDLIDGNNNLFNGKRSDLLAKFDVRGKPYEKVRYDTSLQFPFRDCSTSSHVNSITLSVRDQDGELFDFNGMPLEFELELN